MSRSVSDLLQYTVQGQTGSLGTIKDALIDLRRGRITYLLLRPPQEPQRGSMVPTGAIVSLDAENRVLHLGLKRPDAGGRMRDMMEQVSNPSGQQLAARQQAERPRPESVWRLLGYSVEATDGEAGRIRDLLLDDDDWTVRDAVIELSSAAKNVSVAFRDLQGYDPAEHCCRVPRCKADLLKASEHRAA